MNFQASHSQRQPCCLLESGEILQTVFVSWHLLYVLIADRNSKHFKFYSAIMLHTLLNKHDVYLWGCGSKFVHKFCLLIDLPDITVMISSRQEYGRGKKAVELHWKVLVTKTEVLLFTCCWIFHLEFRGEQKLSPLSIWPVCDEAFCFMLNILMTTCMRLFFCRSFRMALVNSKLLLKHWM